MELLPKRNLYFFFSPTTTTKIYTLSLHDALPISGLLEPYVLFVRPNEGIARDYLTYRKTNRDKLKRYWLEVVIQQDRKSTRLNSSHSQTSYAVFCLKKKK